MFLFTWNCTSGSPDTTKNSGSVTATWSASSVTRAKMMVPGSRVSNLTQFYWNYWFTGKMVPVKLIYCQ